MSETTAANRDLPEMSPVNAAQVTFDETTDVLVVGFGCAGASAAIEAARAGAQVTVLERFSGPGGSSAQSGGELYLGGGTAVQQANGFTEDTAEAMFDYLKAALGPGADEAKLKLYCDGSVEHFEWLLSCGFEFGQGFFDKPAWEPVTPEGLMWLGEHAWPFTELAKPAPRGHRGNVGTEAGRALMTALIAEVERAGVQVQCDTRAVRLVVDDNGRVVGVIARTFGRDVAYRASRGVVLTTGGFADNREMVAEHVPAISHIGVTSDGGDDGLGIRLGQSVGAAVRRMGEHQLSLGGAIPPMVARGMLVNGRGQRFINEDVYPGLYSHRAFEQPGPIWIIIDEEGLDAVPPEYAWGRRPKYVAETPGELAEEMGVPVEELEATIANYNLGAERGADTFHKNPKWLRVLEGPFAAIETFLDPTGSGYAAFTLGGLRTNPDGEVLDLNGRPIAGLYAAGRASSGMHGKGYVSGTSLGDGTFFGRRAGRAAADHSG